MMIWVDIATSPQVLFMRPIIAALQQLGHEVLITTRNSTETVELADRLGLRHHVVGAHGGATMLGKSFSIVSRAIKLVRLVRSHGTSLAVSHGSYSQALVAGLTRIPMVTIEDYEGHPGLHAVCRIARKILVPNTFDKANLYVYGAVDAKIESYSGLKEEVYLSYFTPDPTFMETTGIDPQRIVITMRPPNLVAAYHRFENPLFDELLEYVVNFPNTFVVLLPRGGEQRRYYQAMKLPNVLIPRQVLDGPNLIYHSDLVIGAGGTMNREAAVLEVPVYTLFKGRLGSVDQHLIRSGRMVRVENRLDIEKIALCKRTKNPPNPDRSRRLAEEIANKILSVPTRQVALRLND